MKGSDLSRTVPVAAYVLFSAVTLIFALREGFAPVGLALGGSSLVYAVGLLTRDADILYLAWLDQGSNLLLMEVESPDANVITVTVSVVAVLLLADLAHLAEVFGRYWVPDKVAAFWREYAHLVAVGSVSSFMAVVGITLAPVLVFSTNQVLYVAVMAAAGLLIVAFVGSSDR